MPAVMLLNTPPGAATESKPLFPQHSMVFPARRPQECASPAATASKRPDGESAWPCSFSPQHVTVPVGTQAARM